MPVCGYPVGTPPRTKAPMDESCDGTIHWMTNFNAWHFPVWQYARKCNRECPIYTASLHNFRGEHRIVYNPIFFVPVRNPDGNQPPEVDPTGYRRRRRRPTSNHGFVGLDGYITDDRFMGPNGSVRNDAFFRCAVPSDIDEPDEANASVEAEGNAEVRGAVSRKAAATESDVAERPQRTRACATSDRPEANISHEQAATDSTDSTSCDCVSQPSLGMRPKGVFVPVISNDNTADPQAGHDCHLHRNIAVGSDNAVTTDSLHSAKQGTNSKATNAQGGSDNASSPAAGSSSVNQTVIKGAKQRNKSNTTNAQGGSDNAGTSSVNQTVIKGAKQRNNSNTTNAQGGSDNAGSRAAGSSSVNQTVIKRGNKGKNSNTTNAQGGSDNAGSPAAGSSSVNQTVIKVAKQGTNSNTTNAQGGSDNAGSPAAGSSSVNQTVIKGAKQGTNSNTTNAQGGSDNAGSPTAGSSIVKQIVIKVPIEGTNSNITNAQGGSDNAGSPAADISSVNQTAPSNSITEYSMPLKNTQHRIFFIPQSGSGARATIPVNLPVATDNTNDSNPRTTNTMNGNPPRGTETMNRSQPTASVTQNDNDSTATVPINGNYPPATISVSCDGPIDTICRNEVGPTPTITEKHSESPTITTRNIKYATSSAPPNNGGSSATFTKERANVGIIVIIDGDETSDENGFTLIMRYKPSGATLTKTYQKIPAAIQSNGNDSDPRDTNTESDSDAELYFDDPSSPEHSGLITKDKLTSLQKFLLEALETFEKNLSFHAPIVTRLSDGQLECKFPKSVSGKRKTTRNSRSDNATFATTYINERCATVPRSDSGPSSTNHRSASVTNANTTSICSNTSSDNCEDGNVAQTNSSYGKGSTANAATNSAMDSASINCRSECVTSTTVSESGSCATVAISDSGISSIDCKTTRMTNVKKFNIFDNTSSDDSKGNNIAPINSDNIIVSLKEDSTKQESISHGCSIATAIISNNNCRDIKTVNISDNVGNLKTANRNYEHPSGDNSGIACDLSATEFNFDVVPKNVIDNSAGSESRSDEKNNSNRISRATSDSNADESNRDGKGDGNMSNESLCTDAIVTKKLRSPSAIHKSSINESDNGEGGNGKDERNDDRKNAKLIKGTKKSVKSVVDCGSNDGKKTSGPKYGRKANETSKNKTGVSKIFIESVRNCSIINKELKFSTAITKTVPRVFYFGSNDGNGTNSATFGSNADESNRYGNGVKKMPFDILPKDTIVTKEIRASAAIHNGSNNEYDDGEGGGDNKGERNDDRNNGKLMKGITKSVERLVVHDSSSAIAENSELSEGGDYTATNMWL